MNCFEFLELWVRARFGRIRGDDRGDVPGWVMVTVMSAILVVAIIGVFEPEIKNAITGAINSVSNSK
ncbi:MAG: hypothetical protein ACRDWT_02625 [Jatrophihabitantaceae bacterium]